jgi:filamentous hemagglutinin
MSPSCHRIGVVLGWAVLLLAGARAEAKADRSFGRPHIDAVKSPVQVFEGKVVDFGKVIYKGKIDVNPTLERIREGKRLRHRNDGAFFLNREGRLPKHSDREYYREFVHEMKGVPLPGPCRVIIGKKGEVYFTGDHYKTFTRVR